MNARCTGGVRIEVMDWLLDAKRSRIQGEIRMKKLQSPRYEPLPLGVFEQLALTTWLLCGILMLTRRVRRTDATIKL